MDRNSTVLCDGYLTFKYSITITWGQVGQVKKQNRKSRKKDKKIVIREHRVGEVH